MNMRFKGLTTSIFPGLLPKLGPNGSRSIRSAAAALLIACSVAMGAQAHPPTQFGLDPGQIPALELGVDYAYFHANVPAGQCGCFSLEGVGGDFAYNGPHGISAVVDIATANSSHVDGTQQNIRIVNFLGGPRFSYRTHSSFTPYVQALFGDSLELSNYTAVQDKSGFTVSGGGGVNRYFGRYFGWKIVEADWVHSQIYNGSNNRQNNLRLTTGIYLRLGPRDER
jgi:outer membrane immunogenic protein